MRPVLDEQGRRRYVAMEALSLGHGGVSAMSRISGLARSTIGRGIEDIRSGRCAPEGRVRKPGAGRKRKTEQDLTLLKDLKALVDPSTRGDPMGPLLWTTRSLRNLVKELSKLGHKDPAAESFREAGEFSSGDSLCDLHLRALAQELTTTLAGANSDQ